MDLIIDSILLFGRPTLGATVGLAVGWPTQGAKHVRWVIALVLLGYAAGCAAMWPHHGSMTAAVLLLIPGTITTVAGLSIGAVTMEGHEDGWIRSWGFAGFIVGIHVLAIPALALVRAMD